ncbi:YlbF family regulator [Aerococcus urinaehominis]|nr:YlbF family regulator [Aerococcus urinaehominis]
MMANIYDTVNKLELELREHEDFKALQVAMAAVLADQDAAALYEEFRSFQLDLQMKSQLGQDMSEDDVEAAKKLQDKMTANETIQTLLESEQKVSQLLDDINRIVTRPIQEVYQAGQTN